MYKTKKLSDSFKLAQKLGISESLEFRIKPKLHGTFAAIEVKDCEITVFSKNRVITSENDNHGFSSFIESIKESIHIKNGLLIGEWVGSGINSGDAICNMQQKSWHIFLASINGKAISCPVALDLLKPYSERVYVIDYLEGIYKYSDSEKFNSIIDKEFSLQCCYSKKFELEGKGEGFVAYPMLGLSDFDYYTSLMFKVKTDSHGQSEKQRTMLFPQSFEKYNNFVNEFITESRLRQGLGEVNFNSNEDIGTYLKWINQDVLSECQNELDLSSLDIKILKKHISKKALNFLKNYESNNLPSC